MRVMVIGGTGFIGRHVVAKLAAAGHEVAALHRGRTPLAIRGGTAEILGERSALQGQREKIRAWAPEVVIDMILSSAAQARATLETFRGIARRVVAISSGDVYRSTAVLHRLECGPPDPIPLTEDSQLRVRAQTYTPEALASARAAYPWIDEEYDKVQVERVIASDSELPATILRLPMVYGPGDPLHRLYPLVKRILDGRPAIVFEETFARWVPCRGYVENVAHAIMLAALSDSATGRVYNVAEPDPFTEGEFAAKVGGILGWRGCVVALPRDKTPQHLVLPYNFEQHLYMDSTRIRGELGYTEPVPVEEALRRTIEWERSHPPQRIDPALYDYAAEDRVWLEYRCNSATMPRSLLDEIRSVCRIDQHAPPLLARLFRYAKCPTTTLSWASRVLGPCRSRSLHWSGAGSKKLAVSRELSSPV